MRTTWCGAGSLVAATAATVTAVALLPPAAGAAEGAGLAGPRCDGRSATVVGTRGDDRLTGTPGRDVIVGGGGDDRIEGRGGNDLICAGRGADVLRGGPGRDVLRGGLNGTNGAPGDILDGDGGDDVLVPGRDPDSRVGGVRRFGGYDVLSFAGSDRGVVVDLRAGTAVGDGEDRILGDGPRHVHGTRYDDTVRLDQGFTGATTGSGDDRILGSTGRDFARPASGGLRQPGAADIGTGGADEVQLGAGFDFLNPGDSTGHLRTGGGPDEVVVFAPPTTARIDLGTGRDWARFGALPPPDVEVVFADGGLEDFVSMELDEPGELDEGGLVTWDLTTGRFVRPDGLSASIGWAVTIEVDAGPHGLQVTGTPGDDDVQVFNDGFAPATRFDAGDGDDRFWGPSSDDVFDGGDGVDEFRFDFGGTDTCRSVETDPKGYCDN